MFLTGGVKLDAYSTYKAHEGASPINLIMDPTYDIQKQIGTSYSLFTGIYNIGMDGSVSYGNKFVSLGSTPGNIWAIDISIPSGNRTSIGTTIYYNPKNFINGLERFEEGLKKDIEFMYNTLPFSSPTALPIVPAF